MVYMILNYILCIVVSVVLAGVILPSIMRIARRRSLYDDVDDRKIHKGVVPRLGGIAFLPALTFSFCIVLGINVRFQLNGINGYLPGSIINIFFLFCSLMLMYMIGIADDLVQVRYRTKFLFQVIAGSIFVLAGLWPADLYGFLGIHQWPTILGWITAVFLVVYITNAINLIDGIDGLASGISIIAMALYSFVFISTGHYVYAMFIGATFGTLIPFFYYNVFGKVEKHKKIFMGDTGTLTIGVVLSFMVLQAFSIPQESVTTGDNIFILAVAPILLPCFDVVRVFFHRLRKGRNPFLPDRCHIHHKLLALGCRQWQALIVILAADAAFVIMNLWVSPYLNPTLVILSDIAVWVFANILLTHSIRSREKRLGVVLYD